MTEPITLPPRQMKAALANPLPGGLYTAGTLVELTKPARIDGGVQVEQSNCGFNVRRWELGCDPDGNPVDKGDGDRDEPEGTTFPAFGVVATDKCGLLGRNEEEAQARARQAMRLQESIQAEEHTADLLVARAGTPADAVDPARDKAIKGAVAALEAAMAAMGIQGVIHAHVQLAAELKGLITPGTGGKLFTPAGHQFAFGAGYGALGNTLLVGTGPVTIYRTPVDVLPSMEVRRNERLVVAEREVAVTWECGQWAHLI